MTHRLMLIGCHSPDEQSLKWVLAVLLMVCYQDLPSAQIRHDKLLELKAIVANEKKVFQHLPFLASYPDQPSGLPATIRDHAYGD